MPISKIKAGGINDDAVTTAKIVDGTVAAVDIADGAVTSAKIQDGAVTAAKIQNNAVTTAKIQDGDVTSAKLDTNIDIAGTLDVTGVATLDDGLVVDNDGATVATFDRATSDGTIIDLQKDGSSIGAIGVTAGDNLYVSSTATDHAGLVFNNTGMGPWVNGASSDDTMVIGTSANRFKDLYLSGGVYLGGTGSANHLDDYEEGTWTPTMPSASSVTIDDAVGKYVKIGKFVWFQARLDWDSLVGTSARVGGLPFTVENTGVEADFSMSITPYVNDGFGSIPSGKGYINGYCDRATTNINFTWQPNSAAANFDSSGNIYICGGYISV